METYEILAISIAGVLALLFLYRLYSSVHKNWITLVYRKFIHYVVYPRIFPWRHPGVPNPTRAEGLFYIIHLAVALFCNIYKVSSFSAAGTRAGQLATAYLVPLIAVRQIHWAASLLGMRLGAFEVFHKSMGIMAAIQAMIHSVSALPGVKWTDLDPIFGLICFISVLLLAILPLARRLAYEVFLKSHLVLTVVLAVFLWEHLRLKSRLSKMLIFGATVFLICSSILQFMVQFYTNVKIRLSGFAIGRVLSAKHEDNITLLEFDLSRAITFKPGQYILLTLWTLRHGSWLQRHPLTIAWWDTSSTTQSTDRIWMAVHAESGWTSRIAESQQFLVGCSMWLQGPFGQPPDLAAYGNVLMIASGSDGILMQLPLLRGLVDRFQVSDSKTRKVKVVWQVQNFPEIFSNWLTELLDVSSEINGVETKELLDFSVHCSPEYKRRFDLSKDSMKANRRLRFIADGPDVDAYVATSVGSASRKTAIVVSGYHRLCERVRRALLSRHATDVDFIPLEYQPRTEFVRHRGTAL